MSHIYQALEQIINVSLGLTENGYFEAEFDAQWRSQCEFERAGDTSLWRPYPQNVPVNFSGLANALEAPIHPDIQAYFGAFWSGCLQAKSHEGPVSLIQLWNSEDFDRLIENLIGHLFVKQRAKMPFTVFFATTDPDSELFLSIENSTGKILLEEPGRPPIKEVDANICDFLNRLSAEKNKPEIY